MNEILLLALCQLTNFFKQTEAVVPVAVGQTLGFIPADIFQKRCVEKKRDLRLRDIFTIILFWNNWINQDFRYPTTSKFSGSINH